MSRSDKDVEKYGVDFQIRSCISPSKTWSHWELLYSWNWVEIKELFAREDSIDMVEVHMGNTHYQIRVTPLDVL